MEALSRDASKAVFEASEAVIKASIAIRSERPDTPEDISDWDLVQEALSERVDLIQEFRNSERE